MQNFDDLDIEGRNPSYLSEEEREKDESDRKRLMRCSVTAEDGTLRPVYSRTDDGDIWCHICNIALFGSHKLQSHNTSSRHKIKLDEWPYPVSLWSKRDSQKSSIQSISTLNDALAPGEPVPPGMEDQITRSTQIQTSLDRHQSSPLVGLEYLLELIDNDSCEPSYTCVLCDKRGDPRTVMAHITSYNHRITYLNRHFPTISRAITDLPRTPNYKRGANEISVLVAKKIEEKFGRLHPQLVDKTQFEKNKLQFIKNVYQDYHFRETPELTFMEVYDVRWVTNFEEKLAEITGESKKDEIIEEKPKKEDNMEKAFPKKIEPDTSKSGMKIRILTKEKLSKKSEKELKTDPTDDMKSLSSLSSISSSPSPTRSRSRSNSLTRNRDKPVRHRPTGKQSRYGRSRSRSRSMEPLRERDKWDKFREQIRRAEETLDRALKFHEKNPEKHPAYPDEWKKFWNRRYKELQAEGKDPSKHDFKPEWIDFWNKRMREIHNEQLSQRKEEIRKRLELPEDKPPENKWISPREKPREKEERISPPKRSRHHVESDDDVEYVGTKMLKPERSEYRERHEREIVRDREYGYLYREKPAYRNYYVPTPRPPMPRSRHYQAYAIKEKSSSPPKDDNLKEDLEIVGLLRLLTALEGQLGSLGPKVVSLLSKALAAEKAKPNSADELLFDEEVSVLFETVKEKLKGQLFAGMIEKVAIAATKSAIQNIAQLLHKAAEEKKKKQEEEEKRQKQTQEIAKSIAALSARTLFPTLRSEPVSVPGIGSIDKVAIAQQIAAALIAQGRNNVSQDELETLINAVVGMAEASQRSDKPVTAANFVKSLTSNPQPVETSVSNTPSSTTAIPGILESPVVEKVKETPIVPPKVVDPIEAHAARMEKLTDNDLKELLQNFKELGTDEQHGLINFLKKLEASDPGRVEKLRGYVNLGGTSSQKVESPSRDIEEIPIKSSRSISPFTSRKGAINPVEDDHQKWKPKLDIFADEEEEKKRKDDDRNRKLELSDDDDDYTFEDIYKAADKNVAENEKARRSNSLSRSWSRSRSKSPLNKKDSKSSDPTAILNETKRLIANIMGDLPNKFVPKSHTPQRERQNSLNADLAPPGSTNISIPPISNYPTNFPLSNQQNSNPYSTSLNNQNFSNYQQSQQQPIPPPPQPPQGFNHQGYMNNMPSNMGSMPNNMGNIPSNMSNMNPGMGGSMSNMNNGYNNYNNQPPYNNLNNQNQYGGPSVQQNQYPPQQMYGGSQYGAPSAPIGYPQQSQYGNYSQQRFY